jgi:hypothetical protein
MSQDREYTRPEDVRIMPAQAGQGPGETRREGPAGRPEFRLCRQERRKLERWKVIKRRG